VLNKNVIINIDMKWCSILVGIVNSEDGPKNPLKAYRWSSWCWLL